MSRLSFLCALLLCALLCTQTSTANDDNPVLPPSLSALETSGYQDPSNRVRISAFNIQIFGEKKISDKRVVVELLKILARYDLVLVQEIRDSSRSAFKKLVDMLIKETGEEWLFTISDRLGRSSSKEQYAYLYRTDVMSLTKAFVYDDSQHDYFERTPYCAVFHMPKAAVSDVLMIGIHTKPSAAEEEVSRLVDVYDEASRITGVKDAILLGDFNADCGYVTAKEWPTVALRNDPRFVWLIDDTVDTTTKDTDCAYDRLVVAGGNLQAAVVPGHSVPFNFDREFDLKENLTIDVSDHYPIEMKLYGAVSPKIKDQVSVSHSYSVHSDVIVTLDALRVLSKEADVSGFQINAIKIGRGIKLVTASHYGVNDVIKVLCAFKDEQPNLLSDSVVAAVGSYLATNMLQPVSRVPGLPASESDTYNVIITYSGSTFTYDVTVTKVIY